jgi:hypothetical protein
MKNTTLQSKLHPVVSYLPKRELAKLFPLSDFQSVSKLLADPKQKAWMKREMKLNPNGCLATAVKNGRKAHAALETGVAKDELNAAVLEAFDKEFSTDLEEVWGIEEWLAHPFGFKGRFDGVGVFQGKVTLFDHKKTNDRKTFSKIKKYFHQLVAYKMGHEHLYPDFPIEQVAVFNIWGTDPSSVGAQAFVLPPKEVSEYESFVTSRCSIQLTN